MAGALKKMANAIERLDSYEILEPDSRVYIDAGPLYELLDGEEEPNLTLGDLRAMVEEAKAAGLV